MMAKSKQNKTALVASLHEPEVIPKAPAHNDNEFQRNAALSRVKPEVIISHFESEADVKFGGEIGKLELAQPELEARKKRMDKREALLNEKLDSTPREIKACDVRDEGNAAPTFKQWHWGDRVTFGALSVALIAMLLVAGGNVYVGLMSSGQPVFLDNPFLAVMLSALAPAGSLAIKSVSHFFEHPKNKKRFTIGTYALATVVFFIWIGLFSQNYANAGSLDIEALLSSEAKGPWLLLTQMLGEVLVAAALALSLQDIYLKYTPHCFIDNPVYHTLLKERSEIITEKETIALERGRVHARLVELRASRQAYINEELVRYSALAAKRASFAAANDI